MADYALPSVVEKRVRFFDGQFLQDQDFIDEQNYQLDREHRHNRLLHGAGIAEGLTVSATQPNQVTVAPGTAIDDDGHQLMLAEATPVDLPGGSFNDKQGIELYLSYLESAEDAQTVAGSADFTRWLERPQLTALAPGDAYSGTAPPVLLAKLALDHVGRVTVDTTVCVYAGARLPGPSADAASLRATAAGSVDLAGSLTVDGNVGVGTASPGAKLEVAGGGGLSVDLLVNGRLRSNNNDGGLWVAGDRLVGGFDTNKIGFFNGNVWQFAVLNNGYVGIGTTAPSARLTVNGDLTFAAAPATITGAGRLHITGAELLYLLNKSGVVVGKEWGGTGNLTVEGDLQTGGSALVSGNVGIGTTTPAVKLHVSGGKAQFDGKQQILFTDDDVTNNLKLQLWSGYGLGINSGTLFYAANGRHSWRDNNGTNERMALTTGATGGLIVTGTGASSFAGSVGVGTTSPKVKLEVDGGGGTSIDLLVNGRLQSNNNDGGLWVASDRFVGGFDTNKIGFYSASAWRLAVLNNGYVGIGTTAPSAMLTVNGDLTFAAAPTTIRCDGGRLHITGGEILYLLNKSGVIIGKEWGGTGGLTVEGDLHTGGNVGIGTSDTSNQRLCVSGTTWLRGDTFVTGRFVMQINDTTWWGIGPKQSGLDPTQWAAYYGTGGPGTSDVRLKAELRPITHALGLVRRLQGVRYRWGDSGLKYFTQGIDRNVSAGPNATEDDSDRIRESERRKALEALSGDRLGLVAQDVESVIPELVHEGGDGYKQIRYQHLTALLVEAIKEQDALVRALSARVAALSTGQPDRAVQ